MFREESQRGKKPSFEAYQKTIELKRSKGGGIDWWRYQTEILKPLLIPFAKKMMEIRPNTIVMEDSAPCHIAKKNKEVYSLASVKMMLWAGNSPDLNAIKPLQFHLKRVTT